KRTAAAIIEEYEDSETGQSSSTETPEPERATTRVAYTSCLRRLLRRVLGRNSAEENAQLMRRRQRNGRRSVKHFMVSVPTELLLHALLRKLEGNGTDREGRGEGGGREGLSENRAAELSVMMRRQLRHELQESTLWLLDTFELLSAEGSAPFGHGGEARAEGFDALSDRFIDELCALMQRANYQLFSQQEWDFAQKENFMFTLPVTPVRQLQPFPSLPPSLHHSLPSLPALPSYLAWPPVSTCHSCVRKSWETLDSAMISRLFVRHPHLGLQSAQLARYNTLTTGGGEQRQRVGHVPAFGPRDLGGRDMHAWARAHSPRDSHVDVMCMHA
ncbi:MAG: hypothetical protein SGPRY_004986, partial [Prymnesium sp.]